MIAIIPARGGSKGLPDKNIRLLAGKPLIAYTIEAALQSNEVSRVIISTDCSKIASVAQTYGAEIPFMRPVALAQDHSLIIDTYIYTIDRLNQEGGNINEFIALLPTAPLRKARDIDAAIQLYRQKNADSVISYYPAPHPVQWYKYIDENGVLRSFFEEGNRLANRQEEKKAYLPNGAIYVFKYHIIKTLRVYYTERSYPYIMPQERSIDIDTLTDFRYAEYLLDNASASDC
jgi:N-acylneuraminate cytidylyltransferase/CMP-N,N'-diacetyllegionaminic acid synthase